jgi:hypothetical protein
MRIFELTEDHELKSVGTATTARVQADGSWRLSHYASTTFGGDRIESLHQDSREFASTVGGDFLALTVSSPRQLETRVLWNLIRHLKQNDLESTEQEFALWSRIARTVAILFAALLAVPFVFGSLRSAGSGTRTLLGVLIGVTFFLVQRMLESGALVFDASPVVLAWSPTVLLGGVALRADRANSLAATFSSRPSQEQVLASSSSSCFLKIASYLYPGSRTPRPSSARRASPRSGRAASQAWPAACRNGSGRGRAGGRAGAGSGNFAASCGSRRVAIATKALSPSRCPVNSMTWPSKVR